MSNLNSSTGPPPPPPPGRSTRAGPSPGLRTAGARRPLSASQLADLITSIAQGTATDEQIEAFDLQLRCSDHFRQEVMGRESAYASAGDRRAVLNLRVTVSMLAGREQLAAMPVEGQQQQGDGGGGGGGGRLLAPRPAAKRPFGQYRMSAAGAGAKVERVAGEDGADAVLGSPPGRNVPSPKRGRGAGSGSSQAGRGQGRGPAQGGRTVARTPGSSAQEGAGPSQATAAAAGRAAPRVGSTPPQQGVLASQLEQVHLQPQQQPQQPPAASASTAARREDAEPPRSRTTGPGGSNDQDELFRGMFNRKK